MADMFRRHACVFMSEVYGQSAVAKTDLVFQGALSSLQELPQSTLGRSWGGLGHGISRHSIPWDTDELQLVVCDTINANERVADLIALGSC